MNKITGTLTDIKTSETLLMCDKEVERIEFTIDEGETQHALAAVSDEGTAYYSLKYDKRFEAGTRVHCWIELGLCLAIRVYSLSSSRTPETDISILKDKAKENIYLQIGEVYALLDAFDSESVQAYALALHLKQRGERTAKVLEIAGDQDAVCSECRHTIHVTPRRAYAWGDTYCPRCGKNVAFDLVDPIPTETTENPPMKLDEIEAALKKRFG